MSGKDKGQNKHKGQSKGKKVDGSRRRLVEEQRREAEAAAARKRRNVIIGSVVAAALVVIGGFVIFSSIGGDDSTASTPTDTPAATATPTKKPLTGKPGAVPAVTGAFGESPAIAPPNGDPPTKLVVKDLEVGTGAEVTDTATPYLWNYTGISWSNGEVFDSSFTTGQPATFALNQVIPGWTEGLQGMKVGGRRVLVIPPDQAYGAAGSPPRIGPDETLVFVVDLVGPAS